MNKIKAIENLLMLFKILLMLFIVILTIIFFSVITNEIIELKDRVKVLESQSITIQEGK